MTATLSTIRNAGLRLFRHGKVRDTWELGDNLLMVASDRISAYDVIMPTLIPGKGQILTQLSTFWFEQTSHIVPNHLVTAETQLFPAVLDPFKQELEGRSIIARKAKRIDIECVVRGYLAGSAWQEYQLSGSIAGLPLPSGLKQAEHLPYPLFTPAIKHDSGHDENITDARMVALIGRPLAEQLERTSVALYEFAADLAARRGIILADTKFEFGWVDDQLTLIDELLTPDSSRFWDLSEYEPGRDQASYDKQFLRDWLDSIHWNRQPPAPDLPNEVVGGTARRYQEALQRFIGGQEAASPVNVL